MPMETNEKEVEEEVTITDLDFPRSVDGLVVDSLVVDSLVVDGLVVDSLVVNSLALFLQS